MNFIYSCTPSPLQYVHNAKCLVLCLSLIGACLGLGVNGLVPISITTLERRFDLSSTEAGCFAGAYKLASMLTMMPVAYYGGRGGLNNFVLRYCRLQVVRCKFSLDCLLDGN